MANIRFITKGCIIYADVELPPHPGEIEEEERNRDKSIVVL